MGWHRHYCPSSTRAAILSAISGVAGGAAGRCGGFRAVKRNGFGSSGRRLGGLVGAREWRNRQTRTVQVRVPERAWGFNSPLAHHGTVDESVPTITTKLPPGVTRAGVSSHQPRSGRLLAPPGGWVGLLDAGPPVRETHWACRPCVSPGRRAGESRRVRHRPFRPGGHAVDGGGGTSADNAMTASFNATFTREVLRDDRCSADEADGRRHAFASLTRHNRERRHSRAATSAPTPTRRPSPPRRRHRPRTPPPMTENPGSGPEFSVSGAQVGPLGMSRQLSSQDQRIPAPRVSRLSVGRVPARSTRVLVARWWPPLIGSAEAVAHARRPRLQPEPHVTWIGDQR